MNGGALENRPRWPELGMFLGFLTVAAVLSTLALLCYWVDASAPMGISSAASPYPHSGPSVGDHGTVLEFRPLSLHDQHAALHNHHIALVPEASRLSSLERSSFDQALPESLGALPPSLK